MSPSRSRSARLAAVVLVAVVVAGTQVPTVAAAASAPVEDAPVPARVPAARVPDLDCLIDGYDDRCETWTAVYDDPELYDNSPLSDSPGAADQLLQLVVSPIGDRVFAFGDSGDPSDPSRSAVVAYRADTGDELWRVHEPFGAYRDDTPETLWSVGKPNLADIAVSGDGARVYGTGTVPVSTRPGDWSPLVNTDVLTMAWDAATGEKLWERTYGAEPIGHKEGDPHNLHSGDGGLAVAADPGSDQIYVLGATDDRDGFYDLLVVAYEGSTGMRQWVTTYDTSTPGRPYRADGGMPWQARVSPDGEALYSMVFSENGRVLLLAHQAHDPRNPSADGTLRWVSEPIGGFGVPSELEVAPDGSRIYLAKDQGRRLAAYNAATGQQAWESPFPTTLPPTTQLREFDMAASPAGDRVYMTGQLGGGSFGIVGYDAATGALDWFADYSAQSLAQFPDEGPVPVTGIGVSPDGVRVYVTGGRRIENLQHPAAHVSRATGYQITLAYEPATGDEPVWVARYSRLLDDEEGSRVAVGPDGMVFTGGGLRGTLLTRNLKDWGIQAYEP